MSKLRMISRGIAAYDSLNAIYLDKADPDMTEFAITLEREHGVDALRDALDDAFKKRIYGDDPDNLLGNYILKKADRAFFIKYMMEGTLSS